MDRQRCQRHRYTIRLYCFCWHRGRPSTRFRVCASTCTCASGRSCGFLVLASYGKTCVVIVKAGVPGAIHRSGEVSSVSLCGGVFLGLSCAWSTCVTRKPGSRSGRLNFLQKHEFRAFQLCAQQHGSPREHPMSCKGSTQHLSCCSPALTRKMFSGMPASS